MFGWINDCTECLVVSKFGIDAWHKIKEKAGSDVKDGGFLRYKYYSDSDTVDLVIAASEILNLPVDDVLHAFGDYFVQYVQDNGYSNVLRCLGSNLRDWLSNLNALHDHLKASYPKGFVAPVFWSDDDDRDDEGALLVHYYSKRGSLLVPLVVGLIKKIAIVYFDIEIDMDQLQLQDPSKKVMHTSWRITAKDPSLWYKLRGGNHAVEHSQQENEKTRSLRYGEVFREGEKQAADLRTEEFVKRCFDNPNSELYHALTQEHYSYLVSFWKSHKINGQWCYDKWTMDQDPDYSGSSPTLRDLPAKLNVMLCPHMTNPPEAGRYPPDEDGNLQSFPFSLSTNLPPGKAAAFVCPHLRRDENGQLQSSTTYTIRLVNASAGLSKDMVFDIWEDMSLEQALIENASSLFDSWSLRDQDALKKDQAVKECVVWDDVLDEAYHSFSLDELKTITTRQLVEIVPGRESSNDPIRLILQCAAVRPVEDDEEDI